MKPQTSFEEGAAMSPLQAASRRHDIAVSNELLFLAAWERGLVPWLGAFLRVQQIHRAHPGLRQQPSKAPR